MQRADLGWIPSIPKGPPNTALSAESGKAPEYSPVIPKLPKLKKKIILRGWSDIAQWPAQV